jgi:hypothetical protein
MSRGESNEEVQFLVGTEDDEREDNGGAQTHSPLEDEGRQSIMQNAEARISHLDLHTTTSHERGAPSLKGREGGLSEKAGMILVRAFSLVWFLAMRIHASALLLGHTQCFRCDPAVFRHGTGGHHICHLRAGQICSSRTPSRKYKASRERDAPNNFSRQQNYGR